VRRYIHLRYSLLPYNYTLAYEEAKWGKPLVRPLFYENNADTNLYKAEDQFMWGENILVAPVLEKNATERKLYLPGGKWYNYFTSSTFEGKQWLTEKVTLNDIPVFIKEGSFLPLADFSSVKKLNNTGDYDDKKLLIEYFPSTQKSNYTLFIDDGKTRNTLENKQYALINFKGKNTNGIIDIYITSSGNTAIKNVARTFKILLPGSEIKSATINSKTVFVSKKHSMKNDLAGKNTQYVPVKFSGKLLHIKLKIK